MESSIPKGLLRPSTPTSERRLPTADIFQPDFATPVLHQWYHLRLSSLLWYHVCPTQDLLTGIDCPFLAQPGSILRYLYTIAAITNASGVPYALTFLRRTNGALSIRSDKLAGPGNGAIALTYAFNEQRSRKREKEWDTVDLVRRWQWHNAIRTVVLVLGTFVGAVGVALAK